MEKLQYSSAAQTASAQALHVGLKGIPPCPPSLHTECGQSHWTLQLVFA